MNGYLPSLLPEISQVDVVLLSRWGASDDNGFRRQYKVLKTTRITDEKAQGIAQLWRSLPLIDSGMRCHNPAYGLRFHSDKNILFEATICWHCFNIYLTDPGGDIDEFVFGAYSETGQSLLFSCLRNGFPHPYELLIWAEIGIEKIFDGFYSLRKK